MQYWNTQTVKDIIIQAGHIALRYFGKAKHSIKQDNSIVTEADIAVEHFLQEQLMGSDTAVFFLGEESAAKTPDIQQMLAGTVWIVDPIDGTAPFANSLPTWGISIGYMEAGRLTHGALFLPRTGELFITHDTAVLYHKGARNPQYWKFTDMSPIPACEYPYQKTGMMSLPQEVVSTARFTGVNPVQTNGSAVYSIAKLLLGNYLCYVARVKLWDIAGAIPILRLRGFQLCFSHGEALPDVISDGGWVLQKDSKHLWKCTDLLFIAQSTETLSYVKKNYIFPP